MSDPDTSEYVPSMCEDSSRFGEPGHLRPCPGAAWKYIAIFYAVACGISWAIWTLPILGQGGLRLLRISPSLPITISAGTIGPLVASYATHRLQTGNWRAVQLFPRDKFRLLWLGLGPMLIVLCLFGVFPALISKGAPNTWHWHVRVLDGILVPMFNYNLLGGPLFEEFGWRGFLQTRLQSGLPPWIASICVGFMWAVWHLPLFLIPTWSSASPFAFCLILVGLSAVMALGFNASGKAAAVAILMHSAFNSSPRFIGPYLNGVATRDHPSTELIAAAAFLLVGTLLILMTRGRLAASGSKSPQ